MQIRIKNQICLSGCPESLKTVLCARLTLPNPAWVENERMGRWNGKTPQFLRCYEIDPAGNLIIPRGYTPYLLQLCRALNVLFSISDQRNKLSSVDFNFTGELRDYQVEAVRAMFRADMGVLAAATGSGKTVMALAIIAQRRQPALIVVHTKELLYQWIDRICIFLNIPADQVGIIGNGKRVIGEKITVALVQSLYKCAGEVAPHIGHLIVDECSHVSSRTVSEVVTAFDSKYLLGLSATPWRRDKLTQLIFWYLGNIIHQVDATQLIDDKNILKAEVVIRKTDFWPQADPSGEYSKMLTELTKDERRNQLIASDIAQEALRIAQDAPGGAGICLALSDRKSHCEILRHALECNYGRACEVLTGDMTTGRRQDLVERLNAGKIRVLIATGQLIGEGFDCRALASLFLCTPISFDGRVLQYLGRVLRPAPGKEKARVFDYIDVNVGVLMAAAKKRRQVYRTMMD